MPALALAPDDRVVRQYYDTLRQYERVGARHEGAVRTAFGDLLRHGAGRHGWTLVPEWSPSGKRIRIDGALRDNYNLTHGFWEAKDTDDDLDREITAKLGKGYPTKNTVFQAPDRAVLMQDGGIVFDADIRDPKKLVDLLHLFFGYEEPAHEEWTQAVADFKDRVPQLGEALQDIIATERAENDAFQRAFQGFLEMCQQAINPNVSHAAVEEMLIQHLLTERLFRTVFDNPDFTRRNVIAREIENVIDALTSRSFSRRDFLQTLDRFYRAIEQAADAAEDFAEKQAFLNTVYEQFFQGFAVDVADTHGIVYTPQPIVDFMTRSVAGLVEDAFGTKLADDGVHVLDPFVGTGNFLVRLMQELPARRLPQKYGAKGKPELHANEVMLLPYYIASMNIEHAYYERTGTYAPFEGICLVDTFEGEDLRQRPQLFTKENTERVKAQQEEDITVIIGNPPYNAWQVNANDNNRNRSYDHVDDRVRDTYAAASGATNKNALYDPYVRAIRWASDRIGARGVVAFVTNNSFVDGLAFDGVRAHLARDFDAVYVLDCGGNVRKNPKLSGTTHNVFGIQVGVSINLFVKGERGNGEERKESECAIHYHRLGEFLRKKERYDRLDEAGDWRSIDWETLAPDDKHRWLVDPRTKEFERFIPLGTKEAKKKERGEAETIFETYSSGLKTGRDAYAYGFSSEALREKLEPMIELYNQELARWHSKPDRSVGVRDFVVDDDTRIKWSRGLRRNLERGNEASFSEKKVRCSLSRPFTKKYLFFDGVLNEMTYLWPYLMPDEEAEKENRVMVVTGHSQLPFSCQMTDTIPSLDAGGRASQCFPFYTYDEDGTNRRENVTGWALARFQEHYGDASITKEDVFHYVYAVLHAPEYRERYAENLKRQLPRVPLAPDFRAFAEAGRRLADLHTGYEDADEYDLREIEDEEEQLDWRVEKMRFRDDKTAIKYNDFLRLDGIPEKAHRYRLGNRSALEWVVDQQRVRHYKRYAITHDPNDAGDEWRIVRLIKKVTTVSVETVEIVEALAPMGLPVDADDEG